MLSSCSLRDRFPFDRKASRRQERQEYRRPDARDTSCYLCRVPVGFPGSKLVSRDSIRGHYKRHKLIPYRVEASFDPETNIVHYGEEELPIIPWEVEVKMLRVLAGRNILRRIENISVTDYDKLVKLERQIKGDDTSLEQAAQEILAAGTPEGAKGALTPPDESSKERKKSSRS